MNTEEEQKMSATPETDAVCDDYFNVGFDVVDADFARKLERERDEVIIKYTGQANEFEMQRNLALSKLEEAREKIRMLQIENHELRMDCEHLYKQAYSV